MVVGFTGHTLPAIAYRQVANNNLFAVSYKIKVQV